MTEIPRKINTFHWHIVDSQSFPLVVPGFETLSNKGAYSADMIYSPKDVSDIVSYAAAVRRSTSQSFTIELTFLSSARNRCYRRNRHPWSYLSDLEIIPRTYCMPRSKPMVEVR
jgi:hypothetical protein